MNPLLWLRIASYVAAVAFGGYAVHTWHKAQERDAVIEQLNATHAGWAKATTRWAARDAHRAKVDQDNERRIAALRAQVRALNEEIDHASLIEPAQGAVDCPDPRRAEWLRLYNDAARAGARPEAGAAGGVPPPASGDVD